MHNKQIEVFVQVADSGSFAKAADAMFLSSVAVMKRINALEERMGVKLLNRTKHGVSLTTAGQIFYEDARTMIAMSRHTIQRVWEAAQPAEPCIRIGTSAMRPYHVLSEFNLNRLPFHYEIVPFSDETVRDVLAVPAGLGDKIDCFVGPYDQSMEKKYSVLPLKKVPYRIAVPYGHPLAGKSRLSMEDLYGEKLWIVARGYCSGADALRQMLETEHPRIAIVDFPVSGSNSERFNKAIRANSLLLSFDFWSELHPAAVTLPAAWDAEVPYGLVYAKKPSAEMRKFAAALEKYI